MKAYPLYIRFFLMIPNFLKIKSFAFFKFKINNIYVWVILETLLKFIGTSIIRALNYFEKNINWIYICIYIW